MQGNAIQSSPASRAALWLTQYERNRASAIEWIDRSWLPTWLASLSAVESALARPDCADALMMAVGVPVPDPHIVLDRCTAQQGLAKLQRHRLALTSLPVRDQLVVLRLRSLVFRRSEVRRVVDLARRSQLAASLGDAGAAHLRWLQTLAGAPDISALSRAFGTPLLDTLDEAALTWEGFCLFERDGVMVAGQAPASLLRLAMPRVLHAPAWLAHRAPDIDANGGELVLERLPILFPELAWSFGCETPTSN